MSRLTDSELDEALQYAHGLHSLRFTAIVAELKERRSCDLAPNYSCPCAHTTPCHERCTCINPVSSSGCRRCCRYGSDEQRRAMARRIVARDLTSDEVEVIKKIKRYLPLRLGGPIYGDSVRFLAVLERLVEGR